MTRTPQPLYRVLASTFDAYRNCQARNDENASNWEATHQATIEHLCRNFLPSGSGIDNGTKFDFDASKADKLVLTFSYHHMDEGGCYDGWTEHTLTIRASLAFQFETRISGRDRNQIKDYLYDTYNEALRQLVWQDESGNWFSSQYSALPVTT